MRIRNAHILFKCLDVVVDSKPRSSLADQSLFGGKMFPRVKTISCGGTNRIRTQHASKNSACPVAFTTLGFYRLEVYSAAETYGWCARFPLLLLVIDMRTSSQQQGTWILFVPVFCSALSKSCWVVTKWSSRFM